MGLFDSLVDPPFKRKRNGRFEINLSQDERELIGSLVSQLSDLLSTDSPVLERLFPAPYGDDEERNEGYAALAGSELVENRLSGVKIVLATLRSDDLSADELNTWMRSINDVRLVLGTILDVSEDDPMIDPDDPRMAMYQAYEYLGMTLERIVRSLSG